MFVNTHVTVSLSATWKLAALPSPSLLLSSQTMEVSVQPASAASVTEYDPTGTLFELVSPSPRVAAISPVKSNVSGSPSGIVCFSIMMVPGLV